MTTYYAFARQRTTIIIWYYPNDHETYGSENRQINRNMDHTNYLGVAGHSGWVPPQHDEQIKSQIGIFVSSKQHNVGDVKDGTSHTLMFGETLGQVNM